MPDESKDPPARPQSSPKFSVRSAASRLQSRAIRRGDGNLIQKRARFDLVCEQTLLLEAREHGTDGRLPQWSPQGRPNLFGAAVRLVQDQLQDFLFQPAKLRSSLSHLFRYSL